MYQAYKGYFRNGRFVSSDLIAIPDNVEVYVMVVGDEQLPQRTLAQKQNEALKRLSAGLKTIEDEPFDEEFDAIMSQRFNIGRELDL